VLARTAPPPEMPPLSPEPAPLCDLREGRIMTALLLAQILDAAAVSLSLLSGMTWLTVLVAR